MVAEIMSERYFDGEKSLSFSFMHRRSCLCDDENIGIYNGSCT